MKFGNRRRKRNQYLLDVKVQTQGRWRARGRGATLALLTVAVLAGTGYGLYRAGSWATAKLVFENPRFALTQVVVENDGGLTSAQIIKLAGVQVGENSFRLDLDQARRNLELVPLIRRVEVRRQLPNRLLIRVTERVAVAQLGVTGRGLSDQVFLVDREGVVMKPLRLADGTVVTPPMPRPVAVLTGVALADAQVGRAVGSEQVYRALELLNKFDQSAASAMLEIRQIDLSRPRELVVLTRQNTTVRLDVTEFPKQLRRLGMILTWAQQRQRTVQTVDLTVPRRVPVTWAGQSTPRVAGPSTG
jgi:cell division protein FtsQ